ncbi:M48 family metalloprotease [Streptosporangium sandarakinum]|uniref:M48 family metalloprotease n=1 Tax=Streptosporangium sandarakinum TaxID=1260955 RepID=UPI0033A75410
MKQPPPTSGGSSRHACAVLADAPSVQDEPSLAGLAELTSALAQAVYAPAVLVTVDPYLESDAMACSAECDPVPRVIVGADLLPDETRLTGVLAHEIAHHALDHGQGAVRGWRRGSNLAAGTALAAVAVGLPTWAVLAVGATAVVLRLFTARARRLEEYDADAYSVRLLDAAGLDGRAIVTATLATIPQESLWYRLVGWIGGSHPTPAARRRRLALGGRAPAVGLLLWRITDRR